ncbi:S8 family serine peptidase [bacterium]|nr:S8 family serine peptidase [candidate division CSSED10-310 bacterium]
MKCQGILLLIIGFLLIYPMVTSAINPYACVHDEIEIMFAEEYPVRMDREGLHGMNSAAAELLLDVLAVLNAKGSYRIERICDVPENVFDWLEVQGERRTGKNLYNLNNIYKVFMGSEIIDIWHLCRELSEIPGVLSANPVPLPMPLPTPDWEDDQGYLDPATDTPTGIDAEYAWTYSGGAGEHVVVCDLEYNWNFEHHDVSKLSGSLLNPEWTLYSTDDHGTAVAGEIVGDANGWGVTGACYQSDFRTCTTVQGTQSWNVSGALGIAIANLEPGDVILLEQQWDYANNGSYVPIEWWMTTTPDAQTNNSVYVAIQTAVANGIHVVEAAGNGSVNLDSLDWYGDSGAIIVGAGGAYSGGTWPQGDMQRLSFSSYGQRVNLQGWGENVYTAGYGDLYNVGGSDYFFTSSFSGTSSASPIVAAAVACFESRWQEMLQSPCPPPQLRSILVDTGTVQVRPPDGNIGPRPNLRSAFHEITQSTPTPIHTPASTATANTPTPTSIMQTPTPVCSPFGCKILMPAHFFSPGDLCTCDLLICNPNIQIYEDTPVFVILDISGLYFFAPSYSDFDYFIMDIMTGQTIVKILPVFSWPENSGSLDEAVWYAAMTDRDMSYLLGDMGSYTFGWGPGI